jgi:hypothetical protein
MVDTFWQDTERRVFNSVLHLEHFDATAFSLDKGVLIWIPETLRCWDILFLSKPEAIYYITHPMIVKPDSAMNDRIVPDRILRGCVVELIEKTLLRRVVPALLCS